MWELILGLTIGPYLGIWDYLTSKPNSGHTAGLCEGFLLLYSVMVIGIHLLVALVGVLIYTVL